MKKTYPLCKKINFQKQYEKTDLGFGFPTPDYPLVKLYKKSFFYEKNLSFV
jgi:hypothetical protein